MNPEFLGDLILIAAFYCLIFAFAGLVLEPIVNWIDCDDEAPKPKFVIYLKDKDWSANHDERNRPV